MSPSIYYLSPRGPRKGSRQICLVTRHAWNLGILSLKHKLLWRCTLTNRKGVFGLFWILLFIFWQNRRIILISKPVIGSKNNFQFPHNFIRWHRLFFGGGRAVVLFNVWLPLCGRQPVWYGRRPMYWLVIDNWMKNVWIMAVNEQSVVSDRISLSTFTRHQTRGNWFSSRARQKSGSPSSISSASNEY